MNRLIYQQYKSIYHKLKIDGTIENKFAPIYEKLNHLNKQLESLDKTNYDELQRKLNEINKLFQLKINTVDTVNDKFRELKINQTNDLNKTDIFDEERKKLIIEHQLEIEKIKKEYDANTSIEISGNDSKEQIENAILQELIIIDKKLSKL